MKVFMTGGTGFVGTFLTIKLSQMGHYVVIKKGSGLLEL